MSTIISTAMTSAGITPPINSLDTLTEADAPYMISGIEGGKMGPMTEEAAVTAAEKSSS